MKEPTLAGFATYAAMATLIAGSMLLPSTAGADEYDDATRLFPTHAGWKRCSLRRCVVDSVERS